MAAKRLVHLLCLCIGLLAVLPARGNENESATAPKAETLADLLILAVKPADGEHDYTLVEIGDTTIDAGLLAAAIDPAPFDILALVGLGSNERAHDETAEIAQCRAACSANAACREMSYERPTADRPVGVCRLKRLIENASFGVMQPVADEGATPRLEAPAETRAARPREIAPPPPSVAIMIEAVDLPPRAEPTGPPRDITVPPPEPDPLPVAAIAPPQPAPTLPLKRERKPMPIWLALGSVAFMLGGAGLYWHSHRRRMQAQLA